MTRFLLTLGVLFALLAVFTLPTAQASTMHVDFDAVVQSDIDATTPAGVTLDAKQGPLFEDVACRPLRGLLRWVSRGARFIAVGRAGSC